MKPLMVLLMLFLASLAWTQQSSADEGGWPICFDESAWADLERQIQLEVEATARDAAAAAIAPYVEREAKYAAKVKYLHTWNTVLIGTTVAATAAFLASLLFLRLSNRP
jgi:hypothetical protein